MKSLISDYKPAPLPFFTFDPIYLRYILFISFLNHISYILVISTKFLFYFFIFLFFVYIIFGNIKYVLVISITFPTI